MIIVFATFVLILTFTILSNGASYFLKSRSKGDWAIDLLGLLMQGVIIPILEATMVYYLLRYLAPSWAHTISLPNGLAFLISFVAVDYLYYWNHRLLHSNSLWPFHQVHHTPESMDLLITSRNSLITPFVLVYLWSYGFFIFILADPTFFILGASLTAALDLWRHSGFVWNFDYLDRILVTPQLHAIHHSRQYSKKNFGANFIVWDIVHGTYQAAGEDAIPLGIPLEMSTLGKLLLPFSKQVK